MTVMCRGIFFIPEAHFLSYTLTSFKNASQFSKDESPSSPAKFTLSRKMEKMKMVS